MVLEHGIFIQFLFVKLYKMGEFKNTIRKFITAKKQWRSFKQQKFRDDLADTLKKQRNAMHENEKISSYEKKDNPRDYLDSIQKTPEYLESIWKKRNFWKITAIDMIENGNYKFAIANWDKFGFMDKQDRIKFLEKMIDSDVSLTEIVEDKNIWKKFLTFFGMLLNNEIKDYILQTSIYDDPYIDPNDRVISFIEMDDSTFYSTNFGFLCKHIDKFHWIEKSDHDEIKKFFKDRKKRRKANL